MEEIQIKRKIKWYTSKIIINVIISLIWVYFLSTFFSANSDIELKKEELKSNIDKYNILKQDWVNYEDFQSKNTDKDISLLLPKLKDFYNENFKNNTSKDYISFLDVKKDYLIQESKKPEIRNRSLQLSNLMPNYQEWVYTDWNMTDLDFISYVESVINLFWLTNSLDISIKEVVPIDVNSKDTLSSQIFYIPLKLNLVWGSQKLQNFLYFARNIWQVNVKWNNLQIDRDNSLTNLNFSKTNFRTTDIYNNNIFSIEKISIPENFYNSRENRDDYEISVDLRFYVKWLPTYKIESQIKEIVDSYKNIEKQIKVLMSDKKISKDKIEKIKSLSLYMEDLKKEVSKLEPKWENAKTFKDNLLTHYKNAYSLKINIDSIKRKLDEIVKY